MASALLSVLVVSQVLSLLCMGSTAHGDSAVVLAAAARAAVEPGSHEADTGHSGARHHGGQDAGPECSTAMACGLLAVGSTGQGVPVLTSAAVADGVPLATSALSIPLEHELPPPRSI